MTVGLRIHVEPLPEGVWDDESPAVAFEELYRRCHPELVQFCRRLLCGHGDPEAIAQEAFVRAWCSIDRFTGARPFWPWLATIARRLCIDHRRRLGRESDRLYLQASASECEVVRPDELLEVDEEHRAALRALKRLKPAEQRVITLRDVNGWSYEEIARFEGVTVESIRGSLKRARVALRRSYAKVASGAPAVLGLRGLRERLRSPRLVGRTPVPAAQLSVPLSIAGDAVARVMVLVMGVTATGASVGAAGTMASGPGAVAIAHMAIAPTAASAPGTVFDGTADPASVRPTTSKPAAPTGSTPLGLPLLPSDGGDDADAVVFESVTASPQYSSDGTVFAAGRVAEGCAYGPCAVLFRSSDHGATWHRLPARQFVGGTVLLPPAYPGDSRIFVTGPVGLQVSTDGGQSFVSLAPIAGMAAVSPQFSAGDPRILFAATPGWEYRDDLRAVKPGGVVLPSTSTSGSVAFARDYAVNRRLLIGGATLTPGNRSASAVFVCVQDVCDTVSVLPGLTGAASVALSSGDGPELAFAWRGSSLFVSRDGGASFEPSSLPLAGDIRDVAFGEDGAVLAAVRGVEGGTPSGGIVRSVDGGRSWTVLGTGTALAGGAETVEILPDGRVLAAPSAGRGLLCSGDDGASWGRQCG